MEIKLNLVGEEEKNEEMSEMEESNIWEEFGGEIKQL